MTICPSRVYCRLSVWISPVSLDSSGVQPRYLPQEGVSVGIVRVKDGKRKPDPSQSCSTSNLARNAGRYPSEFRLSWPRLAGIEKPHFECELSCTSVIPGRARRLGRQSVVTASAHHCRLVGRCRVCGRESRHSAVSPLALWPETISVYQRI